MFYKKFFYCLLCAWLLPLPVIAQQTTGSIGGTIQTNTGEPLAGALLKIMHEPTGTMYFSQSSRAGVFALNNLNPGGPYSLEVSSLNFAKEKKTDIYISLGEGLRVDIVLIPLASWLGNITVAATRRPNTIFGKSVSHNVISQDKIEALPTSGSHLHEYLRVAPRAKLVSGNEGAVSVAGQNNRYNAFYIDGAVNNDVFGLAASGTNGGQAGISPLSIDAIDQFQVAVSPYDASIGNFTGAGINAVTRSGTNRTEGSVYYFVSNQLLTGKTPTGLKEDAEKLEPFSRKTYGFRLQGAIKKNSVFYFTNIELQRDVHPQPFLFSQYTGNTKDLNLLHILANTLKGTYQYDAGSFLDNPERVNADRIVTRFDWNLSNRHKLSVSNRYSYGERTNTNAGNANSIHFSNDGFIFLTTTNSTSLELKSIISRKAGNKLLITYTDVKDDREPLGQPFPRVRINDGEGAFIFGTDNSSTQNLLAQKNWTLFDKYHFTTGKHALSMGMDCEYNRVFNAFIQNTFGNYTYASIGDFLTNARPSVYQLGFSLVDSTHTDHTAAAAKFGFLKTALFVNDEIRIAGNFIVNAGLRVDQYHFLTTPAAADYANQVAIPAFSQYWDLQGAGSGVKTKFPITVSPRIGILYTMPGHLITLRGGLGIFTGRLPLAWPGGAYQNNGIFTGGYMANAAQLNRIRFRSDPYKQWKPAEVGATINKDPLNLTAARFRMPALFRTSLAVEKKFGNGWSASVETMFSKNLQEIYYTNVNLLPPTVFVNGPDQRSVYSLTNNGKIPLNPDGSNPYDHAILLHNNQGSKGYAYDIAATIARQSSTKLHVEFNYQFGHSVTVQEGTSSVNASQWRSMEAVNGRNYISRSNSDFSAGHLVSAFFGKTFTYAKKRMATTLSLLYTGQSGSPVSYVYGNSMTRDDGFFGGYDLIYIPSPSDLAGMIFLPNTVNRITYTPQEQKEALELYIQQDGYLKTHRGIYAERNGSRTPFTQVIDLKIKQNIHIKMGTKNYRVQFSCDILNVTNLLNRNWGHRYFQPNDHFRLIDFAGYIANADPTPQYRFNPELLLSPPWTVSASSTPAYSSRWNCRLGIRLTF